MKKNSEEWQKIVKDHIYVMDPDGWDRSPEGWNRSWYEEQITIEEFLNRVCVSTCQFTWGDFDNLMDIVNYYAKEYTKSVP